MPATRSNSGGRATLLKYSGREYQAIGWAIPPSSRSYGRDCHVGAHTRLLVKILKLFVLRRSPQRAGRYMALAGVFSFTGGFGVAALESMLVALKMPSLAIRKLMVLVYMVGNSLSLLSFGLAR